MFKFLLVSILLLVFNHANAVEKFGYVVRVMDANVYNDSSMTGDAIGKAVVASPIVGKEVVPGWISYYSGSLTNVKGWVKREDVAEAKDLAKVIACWPFKEVHPPEGEATFDYISFDSNGKAKIFIGDSVWPAQTYISKSLVLVKGVSKRRHAPFGEFFGFDEVNLKLFLYGDEVVEYKAFHKQCPLRTEK